MYIGGIISFRCKIMSSCLIRYRAFGGGQVFSIQRETFEISESKVTGLSLHIHVFFLCLIMSSHSPGRQLLCPCNFSDFQVGYPPGIFSPLVDAKKAIRFSVHREIINIATAAQGYTSFAQKRRYVGDDKKRAASILVYNIQRRKSMPGISTDANNRP